MRTRTTLLLTILATAFLVHCGGDGDGTTPSDQGDGEVQILAPDAGTTLTYTMADDWGAPPSQQAIDHLVDVMKGRMGAVDAPNANVRADGATRLLITVDDDDVTAAQSAIESGVELRFRIRAPSEIENKERSLRETIGEFYERSRPDFAWFPMEIGGEVFLYVPEAPILQELEKLRTSAPVDEAAIAEKFQTLSDTLMREVFSGADLSNAQAVHRPGLSTVRVEIREERRGDFRRFTEHYAGRPLAILIDDLVIAAPALSAPLDAAAEIKKPGAGFTAAQANALAEALRRAAFGIRLTRVE